MQTFNKRQRSVMKHDFSMVPHADIPRSNFNRSHGLKTAYDSGYLIPIYCDEALPGDTFNLRLSSMTRLATPLLPFMDNIHIDFFFFAVPCRLLWTNWQRFMGEQTDPGDSTDYTVPTVNDGGATFAEGSLWDYFGIPTKRTLITVNALHSRAYNLIYNNWFRDENLIDSAVVDTDDGPDTATDYVLRKRGKRFDYFTSCLPWPQKGDSVSLPLGDEARIATNAAAADDLTVYSTTNSDWVEMDTSAANLHHDNVTASANEMLYADLSTATASTINALREAFQLQRLLERDARGGTRYTEIIRSHFKVESPDARMQRPEYLGGGSTKVNVTPVPQTSSSDVTSDQGHLAAVGYAANNGIGFTKSFVEHNVLLGLMCARADLTYQQGLNRMWKRQTKYDYYWPALAHLGEQEVLNQEIYMDGSGSDALVFGYQERWAEYRYFPSKITGVLRSNATASLDAWHLSQEFGSLPVLNQTFIEEDPPISRVVAVPSEPEFVFDGYFNLVCTRPMPTYSVPGLIDHF